MFVPRSHPSSPLSLFVGLSLGFHITGIVLFTFLVPKKIVESSIQITLQSLRPQAIAQNITQQNRSVPINPPITSKTPKEITPQAKIETPKEITPQAKIETPKEITPQAKIETPKEITPQAKTETPKEITPQAKTETPKEITPQVKTETPKEITPQQAVPKIDTTPPVAEIPIVEQPIVKTPKKDLSDELEQLLNKKDTKVSDTDFLADASWVGSPRKTLSFPNLTASIPQQYKTRGYGFAVTARITFSSQGWVSSIELIQGSGDPRIDSIFRTELRKIRIEPISKNSFDTITKTFKVSVK
ncbi:MAG: hypothetical protein ACRC0X_05485 [Brevinema sp.]